jgi:hypothetical protein
MRHNAYYLIKFMQKLKRNLCPKLRHHQYSNIFPILFSQITSSVYSVYEIIGHSFRKKKTALSALDASRNYYIIHSFSLKTKPRLQHNIFLWRGGKNNFLLRNIIFRIGEFANTKGD